MENVTPINVAHHEGQESQESAWNRAEEDVIDIFRGSLDALGARAETMFSFVIGPAFGAWFWNKERGINSSPLSKTIEKKEFGEEASEHMVVYIPGMFDDDPLERAERIFNAETKDRSERWVAFNALYSIRDKERVRTVMNTVRETIEEQLRQRGDVTIVGYSCGGLMGKVLADEFSEKYPGRIGLVVHNAPLDAKEGFFVRNANVRDVQEDIGYRGTFERRYPFVVLQGTEDMIVPCESCIHDGEGQPIKSKPIPGTHKEPCTTPKAARRIRAAVRAVRRNMSRFASGETNEKKAA